MIDWISIKDNGLPTKEGVYLVCNKDEDTFFVADVMLYNDIPYWNYSCNSKDEIGNIIHGTEISGHISHWAYLNLPEGE